MPEQVDRQQEFVQVVEDGGVSVRSREDVEQELWAMFEGVEESLASELIRARRLEADADGPSRP